MGRLLNKVEFPSVGLIFDTISRNLGIVLERKEMKRFREEREIKPEKFNKLTYDLINKLVINLYGEEEDRFTSGIKRALNLFVPFYKEFTQSFELYNVSQKQLNYILLKDLFIPLVADISSVLFKNNMDILLETKPNKNDIPIQCLYNWIEKRVCQKEGLKKYLEKKHDKDDSYSGGYDTVSKNINNWLNNYILPDKVTTDRLVKYIKEDLKDEREREILNQLFIHAKFLQNSYDSLQNTYSSKYFWMLIEHYYLILDINSTYERMESYGSADLIVTREHFKHINLEFDIASLYLREYGSFMRDILYSEIKPKELIKEFTGRIGLLYNVNEETAFKFMTIYLPVNIIIGKESQESFSKLFNEFKNYASKMEEKDGLNKDNWKTDILLFQTKIEKINHLKSCLFFNLIPKDIKSNKEKVSCEEMFLMLELVYHQNDSDLHISFLKSRYHAFNNDPKKSLEYCIKSVENDRASAGEHFKYIITEGFLLSAKCKNKRSYNLFYKLAKINNLLYLDTMLEVPPKGPCSLIEVPEKITDFKRLEDEYNKYFDKCFSKIK